MADEDGDRPMTVPFSEIAFAVSDHQTVLMRLGKPHPSLGFAPNLAFAAELHPTEARQIAQRLIQWADAAEAPSRPN